MAKKPTVGPVYSNRITIVELQIQVSTRGRSVVSGTMIAPDGSLSPFKHELGDSSKEEIFELISKMIRGPGLAS